MHLFPLPSEHPQAMNEVDNGKYKETELHQGTDLGASWNCYLISPNRRVENRG